MSSIHFNITKIHALSPGLENKSDWMVWALQKSPSLQKPDFPAVALVPPAMRRRMSNLSKLAVQVAAELSEKEEIHYTVFSSKHGEIQRTLSLLLSVLSGDDASPIAFSQSVHNTAAGLFTIATKKAIPANSIAAGEDSFHCALLDAFLYLHDHPEHRVLVIDFDESLPDIYRHHVPSPDAPYAIGMVLSAGRDIEITRQAQKITPTYPKLPQSLFFYSSWLTESRAFSIAGRTQWDWKIHRR